MRGNAPADLKKDKSKNAKEKKTKRSGFVFKIAKKEEESEKNTPLFVVLE